VTGATARIGDATIEIATTVIDRAAASRIAADSHTAVRSRPGAVAAVADPPVVTDPERAADHPAEAADRPAVTDPAEAAGHPAAADHQAVVDHRAGAGSTRVTGPEAAVRVAVAATSSLTVAPVSPTTDLVETIAAHPTGPRGDRTTSTTSANSRIARDVMPRRVRTERVPTDRGPRVIDRTVPALPATGRTAAVRMGLDRTDHDRQPRKTASSARATAHRDSGSGRPSKAAASVHTSSVRTSNVRHVRSAPRRPKRPTSCQRVMS